MSVFRWRYTEECEGRYCCGDCDKCDKEDEPVDELISRQAALDAIISGMLTDDDTQFECPSECNSMLEWAVNAVKELPTAEPRKGKWISETKGKVAILDEFGNVSCSAHCSECGDWLTASDEYSCRGNYCPNCGARMGE